MKTILLMAAVVICMQGASKTSQVTATDLKAQGIMILTSADPQFDGQLHAMGIYNDPNVQAWKNLSVIVENHENKQRAICGIGFAWTRTTAQGSGTSYMHFRTPYDMTFARTHDPGQRYPHMGQQDSVFLSPLFAISKYSPAPNYTFDQNILTAYNQGIVSLAVSIDYVVMEDGSLIGPDQSLGAVALEGEMAGHRDVQVKMSKARLRHMTDANVVVMLQRAVVFKTKGTGPWSAAYTKEYQRYAGELLSAWKVAPDNAWANVYQNFYKRRPALHKEK